MNQLKSNVHSETSLTIQSSNEEDESSVSQKEQRPAQPERFGPAQSNPTEPSHLLQDDDSERFKPTIPVSQEQTIRADKVAPNQRETYTPTEGIQPTVQRNQYRKIVSTDSDDPTPIQRRPTAPTNQNQFENPLDKLRRRGSNETSRPAHADQHRRRSNEDWIQRGPRAKRETMENTTRGQNKVPLPDGEVIEVEAEGVFIQLIVSPEISQRLGRLALYDYVLDVARHIVDASNDTDSTT